MLSPTMASAQQSSTAFTYQGRLVRNGAPVAGSVDVRFSLFDAPSGGQQVGPLVSVGGVPVVDGAFTSTVDFGPVISNDPSARWLQVAVAQPAGTGQFVTLSPRQAITPAPSAAGIAGVPMSRTTLEPYFIAPVAAELEVSGWQSFTATGGYLSSVEWAYDRSATPNVPDPVFTLYAEEGASGPALAEMRAFRRGGVVGEYVITPRVPVLLVPGQVYSIGFSSGAAAMLRRGVPDSMPSGARSSLGDTPWAMRVRAERVTMNAEIGGTLDWQRISGVPANVTNAFSPWGPVPDGIAFSGNVIAGDVTNAAPAAPIHARTGNSNALGVTTGAAMLVESSGDQFTAFVTGEFGSSTFRFIRGLLTSNAGMTYNDPAVPDGFTLSTRVTRNAAVITNEGRLGLGTTSPQFNLHASSPSDTQVGLTAGGGGRTWSIQSTLGQVVPGAPQLAGSFQIVDRTAVVSRVLIDTNGNMGIGTISPAQRLHVIGNVLANNVGVPSSARFKTNVRPLEGGLDAVRAIEPVRFDWLPEHAEHRAQASDLGFVAEDVARLFPEVVMRDQQGAINSIDYSRLVTVAIRAAKELDGQARAAEQRVGALEADNADLRARLERLEAMLKPAASPSRSESKGTATP
jgi:hypothetical protein